MTLAALRELLELVPGDRALWHSPGGPTRSATDIMGFLGSHVDLLDQVHGQAVAVRANADAELGPLLVLLDGTCRQITLLPPTPPADRLAAILKETASEYLVTTDVVADCQVKKIRVNLDAFWKNRSPTLPDPLTPLTRSRWVLPTSGTTGTEKLVSHTLASLTRSLKDDRDRGAKFRWGSLYPMTTFAGLQVFLQSWCGASCLILSGREVVLQERVRRLIESECNALSATPTMWRKMLMMCAGELCGLKLKQITLGGEIVDQKILDALRKMFPAARIAHIFASAEAGVGFAVRDGFAGFPASYLENPPPGVRLAVDSQDHLLVSSDCDEQEYVANDRVLRRRDGFVDTGDLVRRQGDRFFFLGRADGTINVGGNKVHPEEVEAFLLSCDGVRLAKVTRRNSPITGSLVQAEIVPDTGHAKNLGEFRKMVFARCRAELDQYKVPAVLRVVDSIELSPSGKLKR